MIEVAAGGNSGLMGGLLDRMSFGGGSKAYLYSGARPPLEGTPSTAIICTVLFQSVAGTINSTTGDLVIAEGVESAIVASGTPTWARVVDGNEAHLFDCDVRLSSQPDLGQELVVASTGLYIGALLKILSGSFSARAA